MKKRKKRLKKKNQERVPLLSFFTGGGFLDMGFEQAGFEIIWTNEVNPAFAGLYEYGMTEWRKKSQKNEKEAKISARRSIESLPAHKITLQAFPDGKPKFFGVIGGPPCPDFSVGGKNEGHHGINGRLTKVYFNRICKLKPAFFVFENVPGLYNTSMHREFLKKREKKLEQAGYRLDLKVLNSLEMGVPQDRERLIMIGMEKSLAEKCAGKELDPGERNWFSWPSIPEYKGAKTKYKWPGMIKFGGKSRKPYGIPKELMVDTVLNGRSYPERQPNGKDTFKAKSRRFSYINEGDTKRKSFKRLHRYRFSPTACYGHNEVHLHPWEKRRLSVREAMRIQGIPDEYSLPEDKPLSWKFTVVSNGVPVPLAYQVAKSLNKFIHPIISRKN
ncbi:MAG: hypothetical protein A2Z83_09285 [Omnitrophica bacterium GWA2_52_8]|nr:MAG: hypothetical protein A2Z83_09285 [Omnitrophica bacterium GWA2_52_8]